MAKFLNIWKISVYVILVVLIIQYILGMATSLYASPPYISGISGSLLTAHYSIGILLGLLGIVVLIFSIFTRKIGVIALSATGFVLIIIAFISGITFAFNSNYNNIYSLLMSITFLFALLSYAFSPYFALPKNTTSKDAGKATNA